MKDELLELLESALTPKEKALANTLALLLESIVAVAELHQGVDHVAGKDYCAHCGKELPCPTIEALNYPGGKYKEEM